MDFMSIKYFTPILGLFFAFVHFSSSFTILPRDDVANKRQTFEEYLSNAQVPLSKYEKLRALQEMTNLLARHTARLHPAVKRGSLFRDVKRNRCCDLDLFCFACGERKKRAVDDVSSQNSDVTEGDVDFSHGNVGGEGGSDEPDFDE